MVPMDIYDMIIIGITIPFEENKYKRQQYYPRPCRGACRTGLETGTVRQQGIAAHRWTFAIIHIIALAAVAKPASAEHKQCPVKNRRTIPPRCLRPCGKREAQGVGKDDGDAFNTVFDSSRSIAKVIPTPSRISKVRSRRQNELNNPAGSTSEEHRRIAIRVGNRRYRAQNCWSALLSGRSRASQ